MRPCDEWTEKRIKLVKKHINLSLRMLEAQQRGLSRGELVEAANLLNGLIDNKLLWSKP